MVERHEMYLKMVIELVRKGEKRNGCRWRVLGCAEYLNGVLLCSVPQLNPTHMASSLQLCLCLLIAFVFTSNTYLHVH